MYARAFAICNIRLLTYLLTYYLLILLTHFHRVVVVVEFIAVVIVLKMSLDATRCQRAPELIDTRLWESIRQECGHRTDSLADSDPQRLTVMWIPCGRNFLITLRAS